MSYKRLYTTWLDVCWILYRSAATFFPDSAFSFLISSPYFQLLVLGLNLWLGFLKLFFPNTLGFLIVSLTSVSNLEGMTFSPSPTLRGCWNLQLICRIVFSLKSNQIVLEIPSESVLKCFINVAKNPKSKLIFPVTMKMMKQRELQLLFIFRYNLKEGSRKVTGSCRHISLQLAAAKQRGEGLVVR